MREFPLTLAGIYQWTTREKICTSLNISSDDLQLLAILSKNDYSRNIPSIGTAKCLDIIRSLKGGDHFQQFFEHKKIVSALEKVADNNNEDFETVKQQYISLKLAARRVFQELYEVEAEPVPEIEMPINVYRKSTIARHGHYGYIVAPTRFQRHFDDVFYNAREDKKSKLKNRSGKRGQSSSLQMPNKKPKVIVGPTPKSLFDPRKQYSQPKTDQKHNLSQVTKEVKGLKKEFAMVTYKFGVLRSNLLYTLKNDKLADEVVSVVTLAARTMHEVTVRAQLLHHLVIIKVLSDHVTEEKGNAVLRASLDKSNVGKQYFRALLKAASLAYTEPFVVNAEDLSDSGVAATFIQTSRQELINAGTTWAEIDCANLSKLLEMRADELGVEWRLHLTRDTQIEQLLIAGEIVGITDDCKDTIIVDKKETQVLNVAKHARKFYYNNSLLPLGDRYSITPQSGFRHRFILFTELNWVQFVLSAGQRKLLRQKLCGNQHALNKLRDLEQHFLKVSPKSNKLTSTPKTLPAGELIEEMVCDFGGRKNHRIKERLSHKRLKHLGRFKSDGFELQVLFADTQHEKPSDYDVKTRSHLAIHDILIDSKERQTKLWNHGHVDIIGLDMGTRYVVGACAIRHDRTKVNYSVRKAAYYGPTTIHNRECLQSEKDEHIAGLERTLLGSDSLTTADFCAYVESWTNAKPDIDKFYNRKHRKFYRTLINRLKTRFFDRVFADLLGMVGLKPDSKVKVMGRNVVMAVGMGKFRSKYGLPSLHSKCGNHIIHKVFSNARPISNSVGASDGNHGDWN